MGSFLDVCTLRFHTGKSIMGRSRCLSCGHQLRWFELIPLMSYLSQRGRCRRCHAQIPSRLLWVELAVGGLFLVLYLVSDSLSELLFNWGLGFLLMIITLYDQRHLIIPDSLTVAVGIMALVATALSYPGIDSRYLLWHSIGALAAFAFLAGLWTVSKGRWIGFGDAKLAVPLAWMLGPYPTFSFVIFSFWIGAAVSILILVAQYLLKRGQVRLSITPTPIKMKSEVPFAPFMIAAFLVVYILHADVLQLMASLFYGT